MNVGEVVLTALSNLRTADHARKHHPASKFAHDLARGLLRPDGTQVIEERRPPPAIAPKFNKFIVFKAFLGSFQTIFCNAKHISIEAL
jgi:hypothetical protein